MRFLKYCWPALVSLFFLVNGCTDPVHAPAQKNLPPKTFLWLYPDSGIAEGHSRQHIHWWGEDPDGVVKGFLVASGRLYSTPSPSSYSDTVLWRMRLSNDSVIAFPLKTKRDTFQLSVRAVDNSFPFNLPDGALVKFVTGGTAFWDKNENKVFDAGDMLLTGLPGAVDPKGAVLAMPVVNQPPTITFAPNPNDPSTTLQQPETTFTAATFAWVGTDPDGDETIAKYEIALNDTTDPSRVLKVGGNIKLVSLVVPRDRSNPLPDVGAEVTADVWSGTYATSRRIVGQLPHLKLNANNIFYVRARDIADSASGFIRLPSPVDTSRRWYVKKPKGRLLIVNDYISGDRDSALSFYLRMLPAAFYGSGSDTVPEVLNIGQGLTAQQKRDSKFGKLVPAFLDPAFIYTLHLFDLVCWYTDQNPSLAVAQYSLFQYPRDPSHHGKVIFSTQFETSSDPRGALTDFAPIDSISTVDLGNARLYPTLGETQVPSGDTLYPDPPRVTDGYTPLQFKSVGTTSTILLYLRPVYKTPDADYFYRMQEDNRVKRSDGTPLIRYANLATTSDLRDMVVLRPGQVIVCGSGGTILSSIDGGSSWSPRASGVSTQLNSLYFNDLNHGWCVGDEGVILQTSDGGDTWERLPKGSGENFNGVQFTSSDAGYICGTTGLIQRTRDGGKNWDYPSTNTSANLHALKFLDAKNGIAVGDNGTMLRTIDSGKTWQSLAKATPNALYALDNADQNSIVAVGASGVVLASSDGGGTWNAAASLRDKYLASIISSKDLASVKFIADHTAWITAGNGALFKVSAAGGYLAQVTTGVEESGGTGQIINAVGVLSGTEAYMAGTGGFMMKSVNGGQKWSIIPGGQLQVSVMDGIGSDGKRSFIFFGLPLHVLNGNPLNMVQFFKTILHTEFGL